MGNRTGDDDVDLSGVMPQRRDTVRRRMAALEEYDRLPKRTFGELTRLCEPLGLSPPSFYRLWRSWRLLRDPAALQGQRMTSRGVKDPIGDREYVHGLLATMPRDRSVEAQVLEVERRAEAQGVPLRSRSALRRLAREIREEDAPPPLSTSPEAMIGLDIVPIEIAVDDGGHVATAEAAARLGQSPSAAWHRVTRELGQPSSPAGWLRRSFDHRFPR